MSGLRERNKERRRQGILDAALDLLRVNDLEAVTIEQIAARAEVSPPTIYNLVGPRAQLLLALVDRVIEGLMDTLGEPAGGEPEDPIGRALAAVDESVAAFVAEPEAYRQIVRSLGDLAASGSRMTFDASEIHVRAMRRGQELGLLRDDLDPIALGRQSYLCYVAALLAWGAEDLSDEGFGIAARHGLLTVVAAASTDGYRDGVLHRLGELSKQFAEIRWNRR